MITITRQINGGRREYLMGGLTWVVPVQTESVEAAVKMLREVGYGKAEIEQMEFHGGPGLRHLNPAILNALGVDDPDERKKPGE